MDVILAIIIKALNGCVYCDETYRILKWLVDHYIEMEEDNFTLENLLSEANVTKEDVEKLFNVLGLSTDFEVFKENLWQFQSIRLDQIRSRMIGMKAEDIVYDMEKDCSDAEMIGLINQICELMDVSKRIFIIGALYPLAISTEFQTDMNIFGKNVQQFHEYDKDLVFDENDLLIFISTTGRSASYFMKKFEEKNPSKANKVLITQNKQYLDDKLKISDLTIIVPGRYDGININYQIMKIFDLLRLSYYQRYFL